IGFGRALWSRTSAKDGVEYVIAALPLGGYVKLLDEREGNVPPSEAHRAFNRQPVWKRILVLLAGPAFNLVFALAMYWALFAAGVPALRPFIGEVAPGSVAAEAGLRAGDQIVAVKGSRVETLEAATLKILEDMVDDGRIAMRVRGSDGAERDLELVVGSRARELTEPEALFPGLGFQIGRPRIPAVIANVREGSPGERAGLRSGDEIVGFDGQPIEDFTELVRLVEPRPGQEVVLEVRRDGRLLEVPVTLGAEEVGGRRIGRIGVEAKMEDLFALQKY